MEITYNGEVITEVLSLQEWVQTPIYDKDGTTLIGFEHTLRFVTTP